MQHKPSALEAFGSVKGAVPGRHLWGWEGPAGAHQAKGRGWEGEWQRDPGPCSFPFSKSVQVGVPGDCLYSDRCCWPLVPAQRLTSLILKPARGELASGTSPEDLPAPLQDQARRTRHMRDLISPPLLVSVCTSLKSWVSPLRFDRGSPEFAPRGQFTRSVCVAGRVNN